jgi:GT2 family glycosyltransferase
VEAAREHRDAGAVTGLLLDYYGKKIDGAGDVFSKWGIPALRLNDEPREVAPASEYVFGATGGAALYRTAVFREIGMFDEKYFAYDEDVDMSFRMQLAGYRVWYERGAVAYHRHSATAKKMPGFVTRQLFRNLPMLHIKNLPFPLNVTIGVRFFFLYLAFIIYKLPELPSVVKGMVASLGLIPHALAERRRIQGGRKVSVGYIRGMLYPKIPLRTVRKIEKVFGVKFGRGGRY